MLLITGVLSAQEPSQQFRVDYKTWTASDISMDKYADLVALMDQFNRKLGGCPEKGFDMSLCIASRGIWDAKLWAKISQLGSELFSSSRNGRDRKNTQEPCR